MHKDPLHIFLDILKTSKTLRNLSLEELSAMVYVCIGLWQVQMLGTLHLHLQERMVPDLGKIVKQ